METSTCIMEKFFNVLYFLISEVLILFYSAVFQQMMLEQLDFPSQKYEI